MTHLRLRTVLPVLILLTIMALPLGAQDKSNVLINGSFTSSLDLEDTRLFPGGGYEFAYGWYNVANLRLKSAVNESLSFLLSTNFIVLNGFYVPLPSEPLEPPVTFIPELERLYFRVKTEAADVEAGLIRIARGYGYIFSPLEILNPKDSLNAMDPSGRPKGKWGIHAAFYPQDMWKIELFGLAPDNPLMDQGWGIKIGAATRFSLDNWNFDALYCLSLPEIPYESAPSGYENNDFTHTAGFAVKADLEIGLFVEVLYRFDQMMFKTGLYDGKPVKGYEGLEAAMGIDYTFADLNLYVMGEYLFYGPGHVDWQDASLDSLHIDADWETDAPADRMLSADKKPLPYARHDYLFFLIRYDVEQDLRLNLSVLAGLDDLSALATAFCEYEIVQGLTLQASVLLPLDRKMFDSAAEAGEWGSVNLGFHMMTRLGVVVRF